MPTQRQSLVDLHCHLGADSHDGGLERMATHDEARQEEAIGHCAFMRGAAEGPQQLRAAVRERVEQGVDVVKVMGIGGVFAHGTDVTRCQFALDELRLVVDAAHTAGLPMTVHAHALAAVEQARPSKSGPTASSIAPA